MSRSSDTSPVGNPQWCRVPVTRHRRRHCSLHCRTRLPRAGASGSQPTAPQRQPPAGVRTTAGGAPGSHEKALRASTLCAALKRLSLSPRRGRVSPSLCRTRRPSESLTGTGGGVSNDGTERRRDDQRAGLVDMDRRRPGVAWLPPTRGLSLQVHPRGPLLLHRVRGLLQPPGRGPRSVVRLPSVRPAFSLENDAKY